jgi:hypothetical protein
VFDGAGRMALKIRQYCSGKDDYAPLVSSGSEAFIKYTYVDTDVDVNFEIKITSVICNLFDIKIIKYDY